MTGRALTIAQTADEIRNALREYIEATYHVGHPSLIRQRQVLLDQQGNTFQTPFLESTPRYTPGRRFAELTLDKAALELFARLTSTEHDHAPLIFDPPYTHQAAALEAAASGRSLCALGDGRLAGRRGTVGERELAAAGGRAVCRKNATPRLL